MGEEISSDVNYLIEQLNQIPKNKNQLEMKYNNKTVNKFDLLTKEETKDQPFIQINKQSEDNNYKTLVMIDPDAPNSSEPITGPFIHWIKANFKDQNGNDGQSICDYMGPGPRPGTGKHRYIFLLYQSTNQVKEENQFDQIPQRRKFPLEKFVKDNQLELIDVTLFTVDA